MKKLLFKYPNDKDIFIRLGELGFILRACYFRGLELGYTDIYMEWPENIEFTVDHHLKRNHKKLKKEPLKMECPINTILPIRFIKKGDINEYDFDMIIHLDESDAFYEHSEPIFLPKYGKLLRSNLAPYEFLNKYYITHHKYPVFKIKKEKKERYVLIHTRNALNSKARNPKPETYLTILKLLKENFSDYKIYRCGEIYNPSIEKKISLYVDMYYPPMKEFGLFLNLINNASLYIGCTSGPIEYAKAMNIPVLEIDIPKCVWDKKSTGIYASNAYCFYSEDYWKKTFKAKYGNMIEDYMNPEKVLRCYKNKELDKKKVLEFFNNWI